MIKIENLTKKFGDLVAVDRITLHIPSGEFFAFIGPNGAGKTTTIKMIAGLLHPTEGRVSVCGHDIEEEYLEAKHKMSYVPDQPYLYDKLSGREFLQFIAQMYDMPKPEADLRIEELSITFGLEDFIDELGESYSHGMKQRLIISSALLHNPEVMIIDEPLVGLDPKAANILKRELKGRTKAGMCIFMSTHTLSLAEEIADRVGILHEGQIVALGDLDGIRHTAHTGGRLEEAFLRLTRESTRTKIS
jgi:ABC-2 type transport system ATP-binding protein